VSRFKNIVCWESQEAEHFVHREALEGDAAAFLAVHFPIHGFQLVIGRLSEPTDAAFLTALDKSRPHAIALVEGEPGSGKSHLVKWLQHRWPKSDHDKVALVPRSDGSLSGALERLRAELGPLYAEPLEGIGAATQLTEAGHTNQFIGNLVTAAQGSNYSDVRRPKLADWLDARDAWRVLNHSALRERWSAPTDIIKVIQGADGNRDQAAAAFTPTHIVDLVAIIRGVPTAERAVGSFKAQRFLVDLEKEVGHIRDAVAASGDVAKQVAVLAETAPITTTFIEALNARIAEALQGTLGIQRGELQRRFLEVRKLLRKDAKRLVLLLEDVTNLQGVDQQLIEALLPNPSVKENRELCDLVAVIGVTPEYQSQVLEALGNVQDRLSFHVRLTPVEGSGVVGAQSLFLGDAERRQRFVASYLNAVRLGLGEVQKWESDGSLKPRPNACGRCVHQEVCHSRFGSVVVPNVGDGVGEAVGLYPLTAPAIERFWDRLEHPQHLRSLKTPRGLLLNVVSGVLDDADSLRDGLFPSNKVDSTNLRQDGVGPDVVERCAQLDDKQGARLRRAIQSWGDLNDGRKAQSSNEWTYSGIKQGVAFAFDLEWPSDLIQEPSPDVGRREPTTPAVGSPPAQGPAPTVGLPPAPAPAVNALPPAWVENVQDLNRWLGGQSLRNTSSWEALLLDAVQALDPGSLGCSRGLWEVIMTAQNVTLAGAKERTTQLTFALQCTPTAVRGLTAMAWLRYGQHLAPKQRLHRFAEAAMFQGLVAREAQRHVTACEQRLSEDLGGHPADLAVKSLVLVGMLEEKVRPTDGWINAWQASLNAKESTSLDRCGEWKSLARHLAPERGALTQNALGLMRVGAGKAGPGMEGMVDGSRVLASVREALHTPEKWNRRRKEVLKRDAWATALQVADELRNRFVPAVTAEHADIAERCTRLNAATGGKDTEHFLSAAASVIDGCLKAHPDLISQPIQQRWRTATTHLRNGQLGPNSPGLRAVDDAIFRFDNEDEGDDASKKIEAVLSVPKAKLVLVEQAVTEAAKGVIEAHERVTAWMKRVKEGDSGTSELSAAAAAFEEASKAIEEAHRGGRH
jgi:hypothetical protein